MTRTASLLDRVERVAEALGDDLDRVVFVGGIVLALYRLPLDARLTEDVDLIVQADLAAYHALVERLRLRGFSECRDEDAPVCRFELRGEPRILVDLMPTDDAVVGFSNRWHEAAVAAAEVVPLPSGRIARVIPPLHFVATKLAAFDARSAGDYASSHDLEDALAVLSASPELLKANASSRGEVESFVVERLALLARDPDFLDALAWHFPGTPAGRTAARELLVRLERLAASREEGRDG